MSSAQIEIVATDAVVTAASTPAGPYPIDDAAHARAQSVVDELAIRRPDILRLAESASIPVHVGPALLRRIRRDLHPVLDPGVEADLWHSPLVHSANHLGFSFEPTIRGVLRARLAARPHDLQRSFDVTRQFHQHGEPVQRVEDELTWALLVGSAQDGLSASLLGVTATITESQGRARGLAQWWASALNRLPPGVWQVPEASLLSIAASLSLDGRRILPRELEPVDIAGWVAHLQAIRPTAYMTIGMRWVGGQLEVSEPPAEGSGTVDVASCDPLLLRLALPDTVDPGKWFALGRNSTHRFEVPDRTVLFSTTEGDAFQCQREYEFYKSPVQSYAHRHTDMIQSWLIEASDDTVRGWDVDDVAVFEPASRLIYLPEETTTWTRQ